MSIPPKLNKPVPHRTVLSLHHGPGTHPDPYLQALMESYHACLISVMSTHDPDKPVIRVQARFYDQKVWRDGIIEKEMPPPGTTRVIERPFREIMFDTFPSLPQCRRAIIYENYPRNAADLDDMVAWKKETDERMRDGTTRKQPSALYPEKMVFLTIPDDLLQSRAKGKWIHEASGRVYDEIFKPPRLFGIDDFTKEKLVMKKEDNPLNENIAIKQALDRQNKAKTTFQQIREKLNELKKSEILLKNTVALTFDKEMSTSTFLTLFDSDGDRKWWNPFS